MFANQIQPEADGLTANMEENEVEQKETHPKEDLKLGRLQYKIDYDFNTNNVTFICIHLTPLCCTKLITIRP
jgi:hypothetical protein